MDDVTRRRIAGIQESIGFPRPPIGLAFVKEAPAGVATVTSPVPSACSFWVSGQREVIYAPAAIHVNCPIGVMTMGFQVPEDRQAEAQAIIQTMCDLEYISPAEAAGLPGVAGDHNGIVYGPLADMPVDPDVAVFFAKPGQAMLLAEGSGCVDWTAGGMSAFGRPTCAAIPTAIQAGTAAMSVGCIGFRVYTGTPDEEMIVAVPAAGIAGLLDQLGTIMKANEALEDFHTKRRATI